MQLADYSPESLLECYKKDLFEYYLPWLDTRVYDDKFGGFLCHIDRNGQTVTTHKRTWYDGRGVWVYTYLYRHLDPNPLYLERAQRTIDFLLSMQMADYPYWPWGYNREGIPLEQEADIYGSLFVAEGLSGMALATDRADYWNKALNILVGCLTQYDDPAYQYVPHFNTGQKLKAPRVLGHWMVMLNLASHLLEYKHHDVLVTIVDRCIDALLHHHLQSDFNLMIEYLHHDLSKPNSPLDQFAYLGHGIEVLWMIMDVAWKTNNPELWNQSTNLFKRHVEAAWDPVYGGFFHELTHVENHQWLLDKVLWAQEEVLVGLMMLIEKDKDLWAMQWFSKVYPYVREKFILHDHPHKLWINGGDRKLDNHHQVDRFENYHHPRHLIKNILALQRIIRSSSR